jgi:hypothetical protein
MNNRRIRSRWAVTAGLALLLGALALFTTAGSGPGSPTLSDQLFAQRIAGSYLVDIPEGTRILLNLNRGGSTHREFSRDFIGLSGLPGLPFHRLSGGFGNWTRTSPRSIRNVELVMAFGADGQLSLMGKVLVDVDFDADLESATASYVSGFYLPEQDPLTEAPAIPGPSGEGLVLRRIR